MNKFLNLFVKLISIFERYIFSIFTFIKSNKPFLLIFIAMFILIILNPTFALASSWAGVSKVYYVFIMHKWVYILYVGTVGTILVICYFIMLYVLYTILLSNPNLKLPLTKYASVNKWIWLVVEECKLERSWVKLRISDYKRSILLYVLILIAYLILIYLG